MKKENEKININHRVITNPPDIASIKNVDKLVWMNLKTVLTFYGVLSKN